MTAPIEGETLAHRVDATQATIVHRGTTGPTALVVAAPCTCGDESCWWSAAVYRSYWSHCETGASEAEANSPAWEPRMGRPA